MTKNCNTCRHYKHDNLYCECCFDLDKYEKERKLTNQEAITIIGNLEDKDILYNPCDVQDAKTMAIKALEQEPNGDLISRQAVIDACEQSINILEAVDRIMDLPSVEQEPKWIPVSERLPECSGNYLITIADSNYKNGQHFEISWFYPSDYVWSFRNADVIAWMPLPKPYEPQERNGEE